MTQANNPLHGIKLETIVTELVEKYGWEELASRINIMCFKENPSVKSSLKFLRKTPWARDKVEYLYLKANKLPLPPPKDDSRRPVAPHAAAKKPQTVKAQTKKSTDTSGKPVNADIWGNG
ncbi:hypothetical protein GCM10009347_12970 [Shewanella algicola]|uniref:VF530 family protein n=1 Tax=Shewanella algicola TaxID=640633 RepID=A0A9X1Z6T5_9GAMM|nr:VF530 family protein [Shewanella algicola]MCL1104924.1 VF530 family protein [Shewanella algicola]GGP47031.1 hypothetical protein GCM10009347_12970 [Shewanella algicola]